jgi:hypothetical protein
MGEDPMILTREAGEGGDKRDRAEGADDAIAKGLAIVARNARAHGAGWARRWRGRPGPRPHPSASSSAGAVAVFASLKKDQCVLFSFLTMNEKVAE